MLGAASFFSAVLPKNRPEHQPTGPHSRSHRVGLFSRSVALKLSKAYDISYIQPAALTSPDQVSLPGVAPEKSSRLETKCVLKLKALIDVAYPCSSCPTAQAEFVCFRKYSPRHPVEHLVKARLPAIPLPAGVEKRRPNMTTVAHLLGIVKSDLAKARSSHISWSEAVFR